MERRKKTLLAISFSLLGFLIIHFTAVICSVSPLDWVNPKLRFWTDYYVKPQFSQGWRVFAPVPREDARLKYRYFHHGEWSQVFDLEDEVKAYKNPFSGRIPIKSAFYLGVEIRKNTIVDSSGLKDYRVVRASMPYNVAAHACYQHLKTSKNIDPDSIEISLERALFPKPGFIQKKIITDNLGPEYVN